MDTFNVSKFNKGYQIMWKIYLPSQNSSIQSPVFSVYYEKYQLELTRRDIANSKEWWEFLLLKTLRTDKTTEYFVDIYVTEKGGKRTCISNWIMSLETFDDRCPITNPCRGTISADDSVALPKVKVEFLFVFTESMDLNFERQKCNYPLATLNRPLVTKVSPTELSPVDDATSENESNTSPTEDTLSTLKKIFVSHQNYDVILECFDRRISAHRNVLTERSCVFKEILKSSDITEELHISDIEMNSLQYLLRYIYCSELFDPLNLSVAMKLYDTADKYAIQDLKWKCATRICTLTDETICNTLLMANEHGYLEIFDSAASHIASKTGFLLSKEWEDFCGKYPLLARIALPKIHEKLRYHRICRKEKNYDDML